MCWVVAYIVIAVFLFGFDIGSYAEYYKQQSKDNIYHPLRYKLQGFLVSVFAAIIWPPVMVVALILGFLNGLYK